MVLALKAHDEDAMGVWPRTQTAPEVAVEQVDHRWSPLDCSLLAKWVHMDGGRVHYEEGDDRFVPLQFAPLVCVYT